MKRFLFVSVLLLVSLCQANLAKVDLFKPTIISPNDLRDEIDSKTVDMCWYFSDKDFFHFMSKKDAVYFEIVFDTLPSFYDEETKKLFIEKTDADSKFYIFTYAWNAQAPEHLKNLDPNHASYLVDKRRVIEDSCPQMINQEDLFSLIATKNVLFYTGAGLSVASEVPSMSQLNDLLGLKEGKAFALSLLPAMHHPEEFSKKILTFHNACFSSPPTNGHKALAKLALNKNIPVVTENLDCLHEYSGLLPYRINAEELRNIDPNAIKDIDYIICVGLSYDDKGFLGWVKRIHPEAKIIAIDLQQPSYLGNEDFLLLADLQEVLTSLACDISHDKNLMP